MHKSEGGKLELMDEIQAKIERIRQLELQIKTLKSQVSHSKNEQPALPLKEEKTSIVEHFFGSKNTRFQTLFHESSLGNKLLNADLQIIEVNKAMVDLLGFSSKKDLVNRKILEFTHPDYVEHWRELQLALWTKKIPSFSIDTCLVKKDGSFIAVRVNSIIFDEDDESLGYTIIEDIHVRKSREKQLERFYEHQSLMVYLIAHDLKSPLHNIQGLAKLLTSQTENPDKSQSLLYLSLIDKTCNQSLKFIKDLILIGEIDEGEIALKDENIVGILKDITASMTSYASTKTIEIRESYFNENVTLPLEKDKIARVVENLLSNAIKFSESETQIEVSLKEQKEAILLKIKDQGIGIPHTVRDIVFNRFTKARRVGTNGESTSGLGLYICKRIVELHGGKIWVESEEGKGSTFFISMPFHPSSLPQN